MGRGRALTIMVLIGMMLVTATGPVAGTPDGPEASNAAATDVSPKLISFHPSNGSWWVTDPADSPADPKKLTSYATREGWEVHRAADITGDGVDELLSYHPSNGSWWASDPTRDLVKPTRVATYRTRTGWTAHETADVTGDGIAELLSYHPSNGSWWATDLTSSDPSPRRLTTYRTRTGWGAHAVADTTGDGVAELVSYHPSNGSWWVTDPDDRPAEPKKLTSYATREGWEVHRAADVTGDGIAELLSYHPSNGTWWATDLTHTQPAPSLLTTYATRAGWTAHEAADISGNGVAELLSYHPSNGTWWATDLTRSDPEPRRLTTYGTRAGWTAHLVANVPRPSGRVYEPGTIYGSGDDVVQLDVSAGQAAVATLTHRGSSNFIVQAFGPGSGEHGDLLVNDIGRYRGTVPINFALQSSQSMQEVTIQADGDWTLRIEPVRRTPRVVGSGSGTGDAVVRVSGVSGATRFTHDGGGHFAVLAYASPDEFPDLLINEVGTYRGTVRVPSDTTLLEIAADGRWTIE